MPDSHRSSRLRPEWSACVRAALVIMTICLGAEPAVESGTVSWYTDQTTFSNALTGTAFTNDFATVPPNAVPDPLSFAGAGYSYQATSPGGLYRVFNNPFALTPDAFGQPLIFDAFNGITAVGGLFSLTDSDENRASGTLSLTIFTGSSQTLLSSTTASVASAGPTFLGLIYFAAPAAITKVSLATTATDLYPTAESLTVGVPEPATLAGAITGLAMIGFAIRSRRRVARAAWAILAAACLAVPAHAALAVMPPEPMAWTAPPLERP